MASGYFVYVDANRPTRFMEIGKSMPMNDTLPKCSLVAVHDTKKTGLKFVHIDLAKFQGKFLVILFMDRFLTDLEINEWKEFSSHIEKFKEVNTAVIGVATASHPSIRNWMMNRMNGIKFPVIADASGEFTRTIGVLYRQSNCAARALAIISPEQKMIHLALNNEYTVSHPNSIIEFIKRVNDKFSKRKSPAVNQNETATGTEATPSRVTQATSHNKTSTPEATSSVMTKENSENRIPAAEETPSRVTKANSGNSTSTAKTTDPLKQVEDEQVIMASIEAAPENQPQKLADSSVKSISKTEGESLDKTSKISTIGSTTESTPDSKKFDSIRSSNENPTLKTENGLVTPKNTRSNIKPPNTQLKQGPMSETLVPEKSSLTAGISSGPSSESESPKQSTNFNSNGMKKTAIKLKDDESIKSTGSEYSSTSSRSKKSRKSKADLLSMASASTN